MWDIKNVVTSLPAGHCLVGWGQPGGNHTFLFWPLSQLLILPDFQHCRLVQQIDLNYLLDFGLTIPVGFIVLIKREANTIFKDFMTSFETKMLKGS